MLLWTERHVRGPTRLFLFAAPIFIAARNAVEAVVKQPAGPSNRTRMPGPRSRGAAGLGGRQWRCWCNFLIPTAGAPALAAPQLELIATAADVCTPGETAR